MTIQIRLTKEEAMLLNQPPMILYCPYKYFTSQRRVWWVDKPGLNLKSLTYTICQDCYHNNRLGSTTIDKDALIPIILENIQCNCDGRSSEESFQIQLPNFNIGIYIMDPVFTLPDIKYAIDENQINILVSSPFKKCTYVLNIDSGLDISASPYSDKRIITELTPENGETTNKIYPLEMDGKFRFNIDKIVSVGPSYKSLVYCEDETEIDTVNDCNIKIFSCQVQNMFSETKTNILNKKILYDINVHIVSQLEYELTSHDATTEEVNITV